MTERCLLLLSLGLAPLLGCGEVTEVLSAPDPVALGGSVMGGGSIFCLLSPDPMVNLAFGSSGAAKNALTAVRAIDALSPW